MELKIKLNKKTMMPIILFIALFINEDVLVFGTINNSNMQNFRLIAQVMLAMFLLFYFYLFKVKIPKVKLRIFFMFSLFFALSMLVNLDFRLGYFFMLTIYLICMLISTIYTFDDIFSYFSKSMYIISIVSLLGYAMQIFVPDLLNYFPVIQNTSNINFYFLGITNLCFRTDVLVRNWGPFREPGVFQLFVIVALIYELFRKEKSSGIKLVVFILAIITTFSTTGYIALGCVIFALILMNKNHLRKKQRRLLICIVIIFVITVFYLSLFTDLLFKSDGYGSVFGKLFGSYESASYNARIASILANIKIFFEDPIFGKGISYVDNNYSIIASNMFGMKIVDNTNMLFILLARFGLGTFLLFTLRLYRFLKDFFLKNNLITTLIFITYLSLMIGENLSYSIILILPVFFTKIDFN